jgi:hypothetical protein
VQARRHFVDAARQRRGLGVDQPSRDAPAALAELGKKAAETGPQLIGDPAVEVLGCRADGAAGLLRALLRGCLSARLRCRIGRSLDDGLARFSEVLPSPEATRTDPLRRRPIQSLTQSGTSADGKEAPSSTNIHIRPRACLHGNLREGHVHLEPWSSVSATTR